jgi:hypothetical protein
MMWGCMRGYVLAAVDLRCVGISRGWIELIDLSESTRISLPVDRGTTTGKSKTNAVEFEKERERLSLQTLNDP